jgi:hypothetical protein
VHRPLLDVNDNCSRPAAAIAVLPKTFKCNAAESTFGWVQLLLLLLLLLTLQIGHMNFRAAN